MPLVKTVDDVINQLTEIMDRCKKSGSKEGFFAALYRVVTQQIQKGIQDNLFEDGQRMEAMDVIFANRYFQAYDAWCAQEKPSRSWRVSFKNLINEELLVLQHLLLAMNAHINFDLAIAAATIAPGDSIEDLHTDFNRINSILGSLINPAEDAIGSFSPLLHILDAIGGKTEEQLIGFSMTIARDEAWHGATLLAHLGGMPRELAIGLQDRKVALLGKTIAHPPYLLNKGLQLIKASESDDVAAIIEILAKIEPEPATA